MDQHHLKEDTGLMQYATLFPSGKTFLLTTSKVHNPNCLLEDDAVLTAERLRVYGPVFIWVESSATVMFMTRCFDRSISGLLIHI